jgi:Cdc6-like AAA superfamily ATPase
MTANAAINQRLQRITRRAERAEVGTLAGTFVAVGGVENVLFNPENQILFGRRGTGKTHALRYLEERATARGEAAVYVDLRTIGSNSSIYSDRNRPKSERITTLVIDVCGAIREGIIDLVTGPKTPFDLSRVAPKLDALADAISKVYVDTEFGEQASTATKATTSGGNEAKAELLPELKIGVAVSSGRSSEQASEKKLLSKGERKYTVHFSTIAQCFSEIASSLGTRLWLLLDE